MSTDPQPTAYEEPPGSCGWVEFKTATTEGIRRVEIPLQCSELILIASDGYLYRAEVGRVDMKQNQD